MTYIKGTDRNQMQIAVSLEDLIPEDNPVRAIDAFVESLDMEAMGFKKVKPAYTGRPPYDPRALLKLYIYGYMNKIRSSRNLMRECHRNIELFFLLEQLTPDFRTISDFRKDNSDAIKQCFYVFTQLCISLNLYDIHEILSIDGSKFRAVNGNKKMFNDKILDSKLERIEKKISEYLELLAKEDEAETSIDNTPPNPKEHLTTLKQRKKLYESYKAELAETGETQKLITDPEARMMHTIKDGYHCCFNVQTAVSSESHLIVDYEVTNHINDQGILHDFTEKIKKNQQKDTLVVVADKGYECKEEIISSIENGIIPYVGFRDDKDTRLYPLEFMPETITEAIRCSTKPADIQKCLHSGVLPACFERTHISVEVKEIGEIGAFSRGEDKEYVTCPMGKQLKRVKDKGPGKVYKCCTACRSCDNRCTASANPKSVYFGPHTDYVAAYMYGGKQAENLPPENFKPTNSFYKKNLPLKTILLKIKDDPQKQRERLCISEHPFGTVKWYNDGHYVLCKGIQKTTAELGLSFLAYNFKRVINMIGTKAIIEGIRGV